MVDVMISSVIVEEKMKDITGQPESTMIIYSFKYGKAEENNCSPCSHARDEKREGPTKSVE